MNTQNKKPQKIVILGAENIEQLTEVLERVEAKLDKLLSTPNTYSTPTIGEDEYMSVSEVANHCRVSNGCVYNWASSGKLKKYKINGKLLFKRIEVLNLHLKAKN
ncbi:helix-turn-helix domain-containing protein [Porphyromonas levii]